MKKNILAIEDEQDYLDNYKAWLSNEYHVDCVNNTPEAEKLLQEKRYHVAIIDLSMAPRGETENRENKNIQLYLAQHPEGTCSIVVTGTAQKLDIHQAWKDYGATELIEKDIFGSKLLFRGD